MVTRHRSDAPPDVRPSAVLTVCLLAVFMQMLDLTVMATALPALAEDLAIAGSTQVLVFSAYGLAFGSTLLSAARLRDRYGCRPLMLVGLAVFTLASAWCAMAQGAMELAAARALQGLGAAAVAAQTIVVITATFESRARIRAFGLHGAVSGLAGLAGPLVGGLLVGLGSDGLGWRMIFLLNLPIGVLALLLAYRHIRIDGGRASVSLELPSAALSVIGAAMVLGALAGVADRGWSAALVVTLVAGSAVLAGFGVRQRHLATSGRRALIGPELFADRAFRVGSLLMFVFYGLFAALLFSVSVTTQTGLGWTAVRTALTLLPFAVGAVVAAAATPLLLARLGGPTVTVGLLLFAVAVLVLARTLHPGDGVVDTGALPIPLFLAGAGMGLAVVPLPAVMVAALGERATGDASGMAPTVQQLGSAFGAAVLGSMFLARADGGSHTYLAACQFVLWSVAAVGGVAALTSVRLPRTLGGAS
ncbi:MFS transporter [Nocardia cyriacigeorgica]|uniref:MFS transporter n=1 Tax=Nocardia cyriacigeorgica TaxID=135487 RepID=UPI0024559C22|nr:MFS transporter [Nocardia cyriacigeorgica]